MIRTASAFVPRAYTGRCINVASGEVPSTISQRLVNDYKNMNVHSSLEINQRKSVASVATMGLFGLGGPEIAVILIAGAFLLGPEKLAELGKEAGNIAGELKDIPAEFQKGMEEGEAKATVRSRKKKKNLGAEEPVQTVDAVEVVE